MNDEARNDARYRWLREQVRTQDKRVAAQALFWLYESRKQFDAAVDALMKEKT